MPKNPDKLTFTVQPSNSPEDDEDLETLASASDDNESISDDEPAALDELAFDNDNMTTTPKQSPVDVPHTTQESPEQKKKAVNPPDHSTQAPNTANTFASFVRSTTNLAVAHTSPENQQQPIKAAKLHTRMAKTTPSPITQEKKDHNQKENIKKSKKEKQRTTQSQKDQQQPPKPATEATKSSPSELFKKIKKLIQKTITEYNKNPTRKNEYCLEEPESTTLNITVNQGREKSGIVTVQESDPNIFTLSSTLDAPSLHFLANTFGNVIRAITYPNKNEIDAHTIKITPPQEPSTEYITALATLYLQIKKINQRSKEENTENKNFDENFKKECDRSFVFRKFVKFSIGKDTLDPAPKIPNLKLAINKKKMENYKEFEKKFRAAITTIRNSEKQKPNPRTPLQL